MSKIIAVCKNPACNNEFVLKHRRHFYCCCACKEIHAKTTGKHREIMRNFNKSEKGKQRSKRYLQSEKGILYNRQKSARQRAKNPVKYLARIKAARYLEKNLQCSVEGCSVPGERHHPDYSKPLEVVYLCKKHHMELHSNKLCLN